MDAPRIVIPVIILVVGVTSYFVLARSGDEKTEEPAAPGVPEVEVVEVTLHQSTLNIGVDGQAVPYQEIELSAEVAGAIVYKADVARAGRFAKKDTVLLRIDDHDYKLMVEQLANELEQAGGSVQELDEEIAGAQRLVDLSRDQADLAEKDYKRQVDLHRRGASTDAELDQSRREVINAENSLTTVRNQFNLLKARRSRIVQAQTLTELKKKKAEYDLERTSIEAPVNGVIVQDSVEQGDYVTIGTPLLTIEDTAAIEVQCNLQMDELFWVWDQAASGDSTPVIDEVGDDYQIRRTEATVIYHLAGEDYFWDGALWRIDGVGLDEKTRTVPCRVIVDNPQDVWAEDKKENDEGYEDGQRRRATGGPPALVRGMYVEVVIKTKPSRPLLSIPQKALRPGGEIWLARKLPAEDIEKWKIDDDASDSSKLVILDVVVIESDGERSIVRADPKRLLTDDEVIVSPLTLPPNRRTVDGETVFGDEEDPNLFLVQVKKEGGQTE